MSKGASSCLAEVSCGVIVLEEGSRGQRRGSSGWLAVEVVVARELGTLFGAGRRRLARLPAGVGRRCVGTRVAGVAWPREEI